MADFALWATACETALWDPGTFWSAYCGNRDDAVEGVIDADPIAAAVRALMAARMEWTGTASDLLGVLAETAGERLAKAKTWPNSPRALAGRLRRAATFPRKIGVDIGFAREGRARTRAIRITAASSSRALESKAAEPSAPSAPSATLAASNPVSSLAMSVLQTVGGCADGNSHASGADRPRVHADCAGADPCGRCGRKSRPSVCAGKGLPGGRGCERCRSSRRAARTAGVELRVDGEAWVWEAAAPPPAECDRPAFRNKPTLVALLRARRDGWFAEDWYASLTSGAVIAEFDGALPRRDAEAVAFRACVVEWLNRNPVCSPPVLLVWPWRARGRCARAGLATNRPGHAWLHSVCRGPWHNHRQALGGRSSIRSTRVYCFLSQSPNDFRPR